MSRAIRNALICWGIVTFFVIAESVWIYARNGLDGFQSFMRESPYTNIPITLASVAIIWLLVGGLLWLIFAGRITKTSLLSWIGFFIIAISYLNILRERVRYGDIDYYIEAAFALFKHQPLPDTYLYPPLWATLLSFLSPSGQDGILLVCWIANMLSLFLFYYLLHRILEHYGFNLQAAALTTTVFLLINMPVLRTLMYVQVNFHVMNLIFLSILLYKDRLFLSALALALAAHLKASPALLVLAFLLEFNWKWALWFALNMIWIAAFTVVIYGVTPYFDFINNFRLLNAARTLSLRDNSFDSAIGITLSYFRADPFITRILVYLAKAASLLVALVLCLRSRVFYPEKEKGSRLFNAIIPWLVAMTLASPLIWEHHGIFISLPFLLLLRNMGSPAEWTLYGAVYLLEFLTPTFDYFPWSYGRLIGILILLALLWITRNRSDNTFFPAFNTWAESTFNLKTQA